MIENLNDEAHNHNFINQFDLKLIYYIFVQLFSPYDIIFNDLSEILLLDKLIILKLLFFDNINSNYFHNYYNWFPIK